MTSARMTAFTDAPDWALEARRLTREAVDAYEIRWDILKDAWILPIYSPAWELWGYQVKAQRERYFRNRPPAVKKSLTLFRPLIKTRLAILVEAPLDAARILSAGVAGGVSSFGVQVSTAQLHLLGEYAEVVYALDNDRDGRAMTQKFAANHRSLGSFGRFFRYYSNAKDPGDMTDDEIRRGITESSIHPGLEDL